MPARRTETKNEAPAPKQAVAVLTPSRLPIAPKVGEEYGITSPQWRVLVEQIFPSAKSVEAVLMALEYCRARNLDIFKRPVHIVPMWSAQKGGYVETVWPGVSEIRTTAHRTKQYAGMDPMVYGPEITSDFTGEVDEWTNGSKRKVTVTRTVTYYEWIDVTVYRLVEHTRVPFTLRTFWEECYATMGKSEVPNDMWQKRPKGQHMKVAEVGVLRMAFPEELGNVYAAEEMEGRVMDTAVQREAPSSPPPTSVVIDGEVADKKVKKEPKTTVPPGASEDPDAAVTVEELLTNLGLALKGAKSEAAVHKAWDEFEVERALSEDDDNLEKAFAMKKARVAEMGSLKA